MKYHLVVAAQLLCAASPSIAYAYSVTVTDFADNVAAGPPCSVREALNEASAVANGCVLEGSADDPYIVHLPPGLYTIDDATLTVSNKELRGAGSGRSVLRLAVDDATLINMAGSSALRGLTLLWTGEGVQAVAVNAAGASTQASLDDVDIRGFELTLIFAAGTGSAIGANGGASVTMRGGRISGCHGYGWTVLAFNDSSVLVEDTIFEGNRTHGGVIRANGVLSHAEVTRSVFRHGVHESGALAVVQGEVEIRDSLFESNLVLGHPMVGGNVEISNSTFVGNSSFPGALFSGGTLENVTVVGNTAGPGSRAVGNISVRSSIIANNSPADIDDFVSGGFNVIGTFTGTTGPLGSDQVGVDAGVLAFDGKVVPLAPDSPARDMADCASLILGGPNTADQLGNSRPWGAGCDAGASEFRSTPLLVVVAPTAAGVCESEGWTVAAGLDDDGNGVLDTGEVDAAQDPVCAQVCATCETCAACPEPEECPPARDEPGVSASDDGCSGAGSTVSLWPVLLLVLAASMRRHGAPRLYRDEPW